LRRCLSLRARGRQSREPRHRGELLPAQLCPPDPARLRAPALGADHTLGRDDEIDQG